MSLRLRPLLVVCCSVVLLYQVGHAQQAAPKSAAPAAAAKPATNAASAQPPQVDDSSKALAVAIGKMNANDLPGTEAALTEAIKLNPKNSAAYVLRASLYSQEKQWPQAEADFKSAVAIDPNNIVLKFNLVEIKFMEKQYDVARPGFVALEKDPTLGDVALYDVFLCDIAGNHLDVAKKEYDNFNDNGSGASYYFANAAWAIFNKKYDSARSWLASAGHIFGPHKCSYYAEGLIYLGFLPLPEPPPAAK